MNGKKTKQIGLIVALSIIGMLTIFPFYLTIVNSFKHNLQMIESIWFFDLPLHFDNYVKAFDAVWHSMLNSILYTFCIILGAMTLSSLAAYSFARFQFPGKHILYFAIIMFLMIPGFLTLIPQFFLVKSMKMLNTRQGLILPVIATASVMPVMYFHSYFESLPKGVFEAAQIEGASEIHIFLHVALPLSGAMVGTVAIMTGLQAWNNYIWPLVSATDRSIMPITLMLKYILINPKEGRGPQLAGYIIASIPMILLFALATKPFIAGVTSGAIKA